ncbi:GDSL-type esterase/lipase family protein [Clostridiaceae bacterium HFYG-1003]|nr:GDSL-type esterase/lipase family protein [Clostridiaceae bacterium HFYG-1003]
MAKPLNKPYNNRKKRKTKYRWGRIGLAALIFLIIVGYFAVRQHQKNEAARQIEINRQVVRAMEAKSVTEIEARLRSIKEQYGIGKIAVAEIPNRKYFEDAIFMGDSITQSISLYDLLPPSNVVAKVGRNTKTATEDVALLSNLSPARIFLWYGMNDLENFSSADAFTASYRTLLEQIRGKLPQTEIVLLSILPSNAKAIQKQPALAKTRREAFNKGIQTLADESNAIYMDISSVVTEELYEPDGIHVKPQFYTDFFNFIKREFIEKR